MADFHSLEDEAVLYVLGELSASRRKEFEARLEQSPGLRALVRELEEGAVALSMASSPRRPPAQIWSRIEKELQREGARKTNTPSFWASWWRSGWAVAAASLAGWAIYAILTNWHGSAPAMSQTSSAPETELANSTSEKNPVPKPAVTPAPGNELRLLQTRTEEVGRLHREIAELEKETGQLSQLLVQQRALLGESNRIKFYQLSPVSPDGESVAGRLSPALQRAVFLSIGRQLGWLPADATAEKSADQAEPVNIGGVDFVDLRPATNSVVVQPTPLPQTESQTTNLSAPAIPAFSTGDSLVVAVDSSVVPTNSYLTFTVGNPNAPTTGGTIFFGDTATVVTIPVPTGVMPDGWTLGVTTSVGAPLTHGHSNSNATQYFIVPNQ